MTRYLKRAFVCAMGLASITTLVLTVMSYRQGIRRDSSKDGSYWRVADVRDGGMFLVVVNADASPKLSNINPPSTFTGIATAYTWAARMKLQTIQKCQATLGGHDAKMAEYRGANPPTPDDIETDKKVRDVLVEMLDDELRARLSELIETRMSVVTAAETLSRQKSFAGFFIHTEGPPREIVLRIPLCALVLLFGLLPALSLVSWLRTRARHNRQNLCRTCGYNLTANTSGICPECGIPIQPQAGQPGHV